VLLDRAGGSVDSAAESSADDSSADSSAAHTDAGAQKTASNNPATIRRTGLREVA
jgi:hypothetical protein